MNESAKPVPPGSALDKLRGDDSSRWPNIAAANSLSRDKLALIAEMARDVLPRDEGSLVVFGRWLDVNLRRAAMLIGL